MPADIEVHQGRDGKFYMLDFARLFPPEPPIVGYKASFLVRLLRAETVQLSPRPLCSDAFSFFQRDDPHRPENNEDVKKAVLHMINVIIPRFVKEMEEDTTLEVYSRPGALVQQMHHRGEYSLWPMLIETY